MMPYEALIHTLEHCIEIEDTGECEGCPLEKDNNCITTILSESLRVIKEQNEKIKYLESCPKIEFENEIDRKFFESTNEFFSYYAKKYWGI